MRVPVNVSEASAPRIGWGGLDVLAHHYIVNLPLSEEQFHLPAPLQVFLC